MKEFYIYYRGQNINQIKARDPVSALRKHYQAFAKGSKGQEVACPASASPEQFEYARKLSEQP